MCHSSHRNSSSTQSIGHVPETLTVAVSFFADVYGVDAGPFDKNELLKEEIANLKLSVQ